MVSPRRQRDSTLGSSLPHADHGHENDHRSAAQVPATSRNSMTEDYEVIDCSESDLVHASSYDMRRRSMTSTHRSSKDAKDAMKRQDTHSRTSTKRRYRGFSFTKRSSKQLTSPAPPVPDLPYELRSGNGRPGGTLNTLLKGLTPQKKAEYLRHWQQQQRVGTPLGCADYDPELELDTMSFAHIPDPTLSATTTTTNADCLISPDSFDVPIHAIRMDHMDGDLTVGSEAGGPLPTDDGAIEVEREWEEREEERGFLRALGLEFDPVRAAEEF